MSLRRIVVLLAAVIALVTLLAACGGSSDGSDGSGDGGEAEAILSEASLDGVESGVIGLSLRVRSGGEKGYDLEVAASGPFHKAGRQIPVMDLEVTAEGKVGGVQGDFEGGLTLLPKRGFLSYEGVDYEIEPENFAFAKEAMLPSRAIKGKKGQQLYAFTVCLEEAAALGIADFVEDPTEAGTVEVDGTRVTKVTGNLDAPAALDAIAELAWKSPCRAQLASAARTAEEVKEGADDLKGAVEQAQFEAFVDADGIPRKVVASLTAAPEGDREEVKIDLEFNLTSVNEASEVKPPSGTKSIFAWFERLGLSRFEGGAILTNADALGQILDLIVADLGIPQP